MYFTLDKVAIVVCYVVPGSNIPSALKANCTLTLTFDLKGQTHILFPVTGDVRVQIKINPLFRVVYEIS